jgi:hypothetical protein
VLKEKLMREENKTHQCKITTDSLRRDRGEIIRIEIVITIVNNKIIGLKEYLKMIFLQCTCKTGQVRIKGKITTIEE